MNGNLDLMRFQGLSLKNVLQYLDTIYFATSVDFSEPICYNEFYLPYIIPVMPAQIFIQNFK